MPICLHRWYNVEQELAKGIEKEVKGFCEEKPRKDIGQMHY